MDNLLEYAYETFGGNVKLRVVDAPSEFQERDAVFRTIQVVKLHGSLANPDLGLTFAPKEYGRRAAEQDVWYDHFGVTLASAILCGVPNDRTQ